jgi:hypothetical protein
MIMGGETSLATQLFFSELLVGLYQPTILLVVILLRL